MVWEYAGEIGIVPGHGMTLKKLRWMSDGRRAQQWVHTSELLSKLHNVNCMDKKNCLAPDDFNLHEKAKTQRAKPVAKVSFKQKIAGIKSAIVR